MTTTETNEEDIRFVTAKQLGCYTWKESKERPSITGADYSQLCDQIGEFLFRRPDSRFYLRAFTGTAVWLVRNIARRAPRAKLVVDIADDEYYRPAMRELVDTPQVEDLAHRSNAEFREYWLGNCQCLVAAAEDDLAENLMFNPVVLSTKFKMHVLVYDKQRRLDYLDGKYFMASSIWRPHIQHGDSLSP